MWRTASAGRLTTLCARAHLERSNAKLTLKVNMRLSLPGTLPKPPF